MIRVKSILRSVLPRNIYLELVNIAAASKSVALYVCSHSIVLAKFYVLFTSDYNGEIRSTIKGHRAFAANQRKYKRTNYFLRRAIHRLEKGLSARPARRVFALNYIEQTVDVYTSVGEHLGKNEAKWAHDVLNEYFRVVGAHPVINRAKLKFERFHGVKNPSLDVAQRFVPYRKAEAEQHSIKYDEYMSLVRARRSVRVYNGRPVERSLIDKAIVASSYSPSACNRQPFHFRIYDDPKLLASVVKLPGGIATFAHNIPMMVAVVGRQRAYPYPKDRHLIYIDGSLAAMSFMYALETLGLSSCAINWPDIPVREKQARKLLKLDEDERIVMWVSVGYADADGLIPYSAKIDLETIRTYN